MKAFLNYLTLELKLSFRMLRKLFLTLLLLLALFAAGAVVIWNVFDAQNRLDKVDVAVVIPTEETQTAMVVKLVKALDSVEAICRMENYHSKEAAFADFETGTVDAVIVFPQNFYEDADTGVNTPATIYLSDNPNLSEELLHGLIENGVGLLQTAQAGVYATIDVARRDTPLLSESEIGDLLLELYVRKLLFGNVDFSETIVSPLERLQLSQYVYCGLILFLLSACGLTFAGFYTTEQLCVEKRIRLLGIGVVKLSLIRIIVLANVMWLVFLFLYGIGCIGTAFLPLSLGFFSWKTIFLMGFLCLCLASVFHMCYRIGVDYRGGPVLVLLVDLWILMGSGMLIPYSYLPAFLQFAARTLRLSVFGEYISDLLYGDIAGKQIGVLVVYFIISFSVGVLISWRRTSHGLDCS